MRIKYTGRKFGFLQCLSFGDICESRYWLSIERRPMDWHRWLLSFGPTYNGTDRGVLLCLPFVVVIAHRRKAGEQ